MSSQSTDAWAAQLVDRARARTGLSDLGHPSYLRFLEASLADVRKNGNLTRFGRFGYAQNVIRCTAVRLRVVEVLKQHPEILDIPASEPIFITGLYRSGTTLLHRLLASSPELQAPLFWELVGVGSDATPAKKLRQARWIRRIHRFLSPGFEDAHEILADDTEECFHLFEHCAPTTPFWATAAQDHAWWMIDSAQHDDMVAAYQFFKEQLQVLAWRHPKRGRLVLKWPFHLWNLAALDQVFPDARVMVCRRDADAAGFESTVASICSLASHGLRPFTGPLDKSRHGEFWWRYCLEGIDRLERERNRFGDRLRTVRFGELCDEPARIAGELAAWAGVAAPPRTQVQVLEKRRRQHSYSAADFGLPK